MNYEQKQCIYVAALNICKSHCNNPKLVAALVALMKKDTSNMTIIREALGFNDSKSSKLFTIITALAKKEYGKIKDMIPFLNEHLETDDIVLMKYVLQIS